MIFDSRRYVRVSDEAKFRVAFPRHEQGPKKPPRQNNRQRGKKIRREQRKPSKPEADGIVEGLRNHVQVGSILQTEGLHVVEDAAQQEQRQ